MIDKTEGKPRAIREQEFPSRPLLPDDNEWRPVHFHRAGVGFTKHACAGFILAHAKTCEAATQPPKSMGTLLFEQAQGQLSSHDQWKCGHCFLDLTSPRDASVDDLVDIYLSKCQTYLTIRHKSGNELDEVPLFTARSVLASFLAEHHDDPDEKLGLIVDALLDFNRPNELRIWLNQNLVHWLSHRVAALAAVIEAAVRLSPQALDGNTLYQVLNYKHPHPLVVSVAAQRIRLLQIENPNIRGKIWKAAKKWIDVWAHDGKMQEYAVMALPSIPYVVGKEAVSWLSQFIGTGTDRIAWGAALAALDWASGNCTETEPIDQESARSLSEAILTRLRNDGTQSPNRPDAWAELAPTLIWVLGATATRAQLPEVARVLADAFDRANGIEDAAAVRAGKILVRQLREEASRALINAFVPDSSLFARFWTAIAV